MADWKEELLSAAKERWPTRTGLFSSLLLLILLLVGAFTGIDLGQVTTYEWAVVALASILLWMFWLRTRLPKIKRNHIGFGVAIDREDNQAVATMYSDFMTKLGDLLNSSGAQYKFQLVDIPKSLSSQIRSEEDAAALFKRARLHFLLYGRTRLRNMHGDESYLIDLNGLVGHAPVDRAKSKTFSEDFRTTLPQRVIFPSSETLLACEFAARHVHAAANYVIGIASAMSGDLPYAERLLLEAEASLRSQLQQAKGTAIPISVLLDKTKKRIAELYQSWLVHLSRSYTMTRDKQLLRDSMDIARKLRRYDSGHYSGRLVMAMAYFALDRDLKAAKQEIRACRKVKDATWRYSEAFLLAYEGQLDKAYVAYLRAFKSPLQDRSVPTQSEEFIQIVLDEEPDKTWLYFFLGLINYKGKEDHPSALADFNRFTEACKAPQFVNQVRIAGNCVREIEELQRT